MVIVTSAVRQVLWKCGGAVLVFTARSPVILSVFYYNWLSEWDQCHLVSWKPRKYHYLVSYTNAMPAIAEWQSYGTSTSITVAIFLAMFQN